MAGTRVATGFGLTDVALAVVPTVGNTTPTWVDIPSVLSAAFKNAQQEVEQWGDNILQNVFYHSQKGEITVTANKYAMRVFELLTGNTVTSSAGKEWMYFGTDAELTPSRLMVRGQVPVRLEDGTAGTMTVYWFNCDVTTTWDGIPAGERAKLSEVSLKFNVYPSTKDERGNALSGGATSAMGRFEF